MEKNQKTFRVVKENELTRSDQWELRYFCCMCTLCCSKPDWTFLKPKLLEQWHSEMLCYPCTTCYLVMHNGDATLMYITIALSRLTRIKLVYRANYLMDQIRHFRARLHTKQKASPRLEHQTSFFSFIVSHPCHGVRQWIRSQACPSRKFLCSTLSFLPLSIILSIYIFKGHMTKMSD